MGTKVADRWAIPLSAMCHHLQTVRGWPWFEAAFLDGVGNGERMASAYWRAWPGDKGECR